MAARGEQHSWRLDPAPDSVGLARRLVRATLSAAGLDDRVDDAALLVSEMVTNAVLHARTEVTVSVAIGASSVLVEVCDADPAPPRRAATPVDATTGRGMALVEAMASRSGTRPADGGGKCVWFTLGDPDPVVPHDRGAQGAEAAGTEAAVAVARLLALPVALWQVARTHHLALLRELRLMRDHPVSVEELSHAERLVQRVHVEVDSALGRAGISLDAGAVGSLPLPTPSLDVDVPIDPAADAAAFVRLSEALDEGQRLARQSALLVAPALDEVVALRDWACDQVVAQAAGVAPTPWRLPLLEWAAAPGDGTVLDVDDLAGVSAARIIVDDANRIVSASAALVDLVGWDHDELLGRRLVVLVPERLREAHIAGFTRNLTTGEARVLGRDIELPVLCADGVEVACRCRITRYDTGDGHAAFAAELERVG